MHTVLNVVGWGGLMIAGATYTYQLGWLGLLYTLLAGALGYMVVAYFADMLPVIGPLLRRWERRK